MTERASLTYEDDCGEQGLLVVVDPPLALESQGEDGKDHHLHTVRHPAEAHDEAENNLKFPEADVVDSLGDSEGVVRHHPTGRCSQLDLCPDHVELPGGGVPPEGVVTLSPSVLPGQPGHVVVRVLL